MKFTLKKNHIVIAVLLTLLAHVAAPKKSGQIVNAQPIVNEQQVIDLIHDLDAGSRHERAAALVQELWEAGRGMMSTQVLQEFYVNVTQKIPRPLSPPSCSWCVTPGQSPPGPKGDSCSARTSLPFSATIC